MKPRWVKPTAYEKSVVLGGGLVLFPLTNPAEICATMHLHNQRLWQTAYEAGYQAAQERMREALGLRT